MLVGAVAQYVQEVSGGLSGGRRGRVATKAYSCCLASQSAPAAPCRGQEASSCCLASLLAPAAGSQPTPTPGCLVLVGAAAGGGRVGGAAGHGRPHAQEVPLHSRQDPQTTRSGGCVQPDASAGGSTGGTLPETAPAAGSRLQCDQPGQQHDSCRASQPTASSGAISGCRGHPKSSK
ncbi:hypothetical protein HaLaN_24282 [Haematococcus lacustris]|uniref:Uncharacterized protein n=1 Tax=Haematococcus lacustris TaxID=44745 RepID=A0A6A0A361_HAELA|nr:hypothetical protein HaLaN_24282 [Haematococcus lacustris]